MGEFAFLVEQGFTDSPRLKAYPTFSSRERRRDGV